MRQIKAHDTALRGLALRLLFAVAVTSCSDVDGGGGAPTAVLRPTEQPSETDAENYHYWHMFDVAAGSIEAEVSILGQEAAQRVKVDISADLVPAIDSGYWAGTSYMGACDQPNSMGCKAKPPFIASHCVMGKWGVIGTSQASATVTWSFASSSRSSSRSSYCPPDESVDQPPGPPPGSGSGGGGGGSGTVVCYEVWLVWPDGRYPDVFLGYACFQKDGEGGEFE